MSGMVKIGYFRIVKGTEERYTSFSEFASWDESQKEKLRIMRERKMLSLYCGCKSENSLELSVTKNHVIRVAHNKMQDEHLQSCPKSIRYERWLAQQLPGAGLAEDEKIEDETRVSFRIALPSITPSSSSSSGSSTSRSNPDEAQHRARLLDMIRVINYTAWEKQNYSIKKKIKQMRAGTELMPWQYKDRDEFLRLFFGITNEIYVQVLGEVLPFYELCYKRKVFFESANDYRFFMAAEILKVSDYKEDRKYQYITVKMPSNVSKDKAVVRVPTKLFCALQEDLEREFAGTVKMLGGYIYHAVYTKVSEGDSADWITMLKGVVYHVCDDTGLMVDSERERAVLSQLITSRQLFLRPTNGLENYGDMLPTAVIERLTQKNMIIDCVPTTREYNKRFPYSEDNPEFDVCLFKEDEIPDIATLLNK